jgi:hypothetical protein
MDIWNESVLKPEQQIEPLPFRVELEPMSLIETFSVLGAPDDARKLILGQGGIGGQAHYILSDSTRRRDAADSEARAEEDRFKELVALHNQRCREHEDVARQMTKSQALEDPATVAQRMGMEPIYNRIIADLLELIEQQRAIAMKAKIRAARFDAIYKLTNAAVCQQEPGAELAKIFGVNDPLDLATPYVRSRAKEARAKALADEAERQAENDRLREVTRQRAEEEAARLKVEQAKIDSLPLEEVAAMFFQGETLRQVCEVITDGPGAGHGVWRLEELANREDLMLLPAREYALDRLLKRFNLATVQERVDRRIAAFLNRPEIKTLTPETAAASDDWRALIEVASIGQREVMHYYFAGGCTDGHGAHILQTAVETVKSRDPLARAAIMRLYELAQVIRAKPASVSAGW